MTTYGEVEESFHTFLTYALDGHVINFTHLTGGWVGPTAGLDASEKI